MIGIITAMASEAHAVTALMEVKKETTEAGCIFYEGQLEGEPMVVCLGGVGKALAAMAATLTITKYHPDLVINAGVAGGMKESQRVLDLVVSDQIIQGDYDTSPVDGKAGLGKYYEVPLRLRNYAQQIMNEIPVRSELGAICSQDKFVESEEDIARVQTLFPETACCEMEAGAIAQVCSAFDTDLIAFRSLSDVCVHPGNSMEYDKFEKEAARIAGQFVKAWCEGL